MLSRVFWSLLLVLVLSAAVQAPAQAEPVGCGPGRTEMNGVCSVRVSVSGGGGGGGSAHASSSSVGKCLFYGEEIACRKDGEWWSNARQCYVGFAKPQPPKSDPAWQGRSEGAIYSCYTPRNGGGHRIYFFWSASSPAGPDPAVLARQAIESMNLSAIRIGIVPEAGPGRVGIIGMPVWLWVDEPDPRTWGPISRTASAGGFSVTATAKVKRVVWQLGDGTTVVCHGPGTVYEDRFGRSPSPSCGHTYDAQGTYTVRATSHWEVAWRGLGQSGTIPLQLTRSVQIVEGEIQVIVTAGDN